jgi:hypothetical protein
MTANNTSTVFATLSFGIVVFCAILIIFEVFRRKFLDIYIPNVRKGKLLNTKIEAPNSFCASWILQVWRYSDDDVLEIAGMDAYVYLRFLKMCFKITLICSCFSIVLLSVYGTATNEDDDVVGINHYTLANLPSGDVRLWTPFIFTYLFTFVFLYFMYYEYKNFMIKRTQYLRVGDSFVPLQTSYSVLVENIPEKFRSPQALTRLFESLFPNEVLFTSIAMTLEPLNIAVEYRKQLLVELENHIATYESSGHLKRPQMKISSFPEFHEKEDSNCCSGCCGCCFACCKSKDDPSNTVVDAIEYLSDQIAIISEEISIMQLEALKAEEEMNKDCELRFHHRSSSNASSLRLNGPELEDFVELTTSPQMDYLKQESNPMHLSNSIREATSTLRESVKDLRNVDKTLLSTLSEYKEKITKRMISATGFVTFKSRKTQAIAVQLPFLSQEAPLIRVIDAPPPSDIIWDNTSASTTHTETLAFISSCFYYAGLAFWTAILAFIAAVSNLENLETYLPFISDLDSASYALLEGLLPVIIMIVFLALIPIIMVAVATYVEKRKTYSQVQKEVFGW